MGLCTGIYTYIAQYMQEDYLFMYWFVEALILAKNE